MNRFTFPYREFPGQMCDTYYLYDGGLSTGYYLFYKPNMKTYSVVVSGNINGDASLVSIEKTFEEAKYVAIHSYLKSIDTTIII